jgi:acyl-CoA synthetase (AMP-forming)/AMP-acid ligase II
VLLTLVRQNAARHPDLPALVLDDRVVTYRELADRGERLARGLEVRGIERLACVLDDVVALIALLSGASEVGAEACSYPRDIQASEVDGLAASLGHDIVVTDRADVAGVRGLDVGELSTSEGGAPAPAASPTILVLTTGTTGSMRAAVHDWRTLVGSVRHPDPEPGARWLLVYNLNQFAGIQMLLHALVSAATLVVPRSQHAADCLDAMRRHGVTHASGTPTFWRLLVGAVDADPLPPPALQQVTLGGEAVPGALLDRIREVFSTARISQVYATTELGSVVSVTDGRPGLPLSVLERGQDAPVQLRVVDGELQARSTVGMIGYHGAEPPSSDWRPTGDLVEITEDRIQFVGRTSDVINVGGVKVHPLPVEDAVADVPGVHLARAYGRSNPVTGEVVALDIVAASGADHAEIEAAVRRACSQLVPAARPRRIRFVDELDVRGSKILRRTGAG